MTPVSSQTVPLVIDDACHQALAERWLSPRATDAHKGDFGPLLCIGGDAGYSGAILLAAETALRAGAGVITVACARATAAGIWLHRPELMAQAVTQRAALTPLIRQAKALVAGPGLGQGDLGRELWPALADVDRIHVLDADGLNWLAQNPQAHAARIITPHPGEAARLLQTTVAEVQRDRRAAVVALQHQYGGVVVLKGAGTLIADASRLWQCPAGNPGMATPGMGDVLAGLVGALLVQDVDLFHAAALAVSLHARAADQVARTQGARGLLASDLWSALPALINPGTDL